MMKDDRRRTASGVEYSVGSGNVFADLDLPDAEELQFKSQLIFEIGRILEEKGLSQVEAAAIIGMDQPTLSKLLRGKFLKCSTDRLFDILNRLGRSVEVRIAEEQKPQTARTRVLA